MACILCDLLGLKLMDICHLESNAIVMKTVRESQGSVASIMLF